MTPALTTRWPARVLRHLGARAATAAGVLLDRGPVRLTGPARRALARRGRGAVTSGLMDYGPDWPPMPPKPPPYPHALLRRCVAAVILYAVIWALGSTLLQLRLLELRRHDGGAVTTYTTVTGPRGH